MGLLDENHVYSYTQLCTFAECPYAFYLQKIERPKPELVNNAFASLGSFIHELIDQWAKGLIKAEDLPAEYKKRYKESVPEAWPRMLAAKGYAEKAYNQGLEYFRNFDCFDGYKIIGTETKFKTDIAGRPFVGVVDMVMEDKSNGELIVLDHKSKSMKEFKKTENEMYKQQLLYSKYIHDEYGKWPDRLMFNLFKEPNNCRMSRPFTKEDFVEAYTWATDAIERIEKYELMDFFETKKSDFFCTEICSCRKICPNGHATR